MSSDKAEEHFDGSSGINLVVLCKVLDDKHSDCSVGSYPVLLDQDPLTHDMDSEDIQRGSFVGWKHRLSNLHGIS